jgi:ribosome-associated protein
LPELISLPSGKLETLSLCVQNPGVQSADVLSELTFITSRSGGPGGQNVNKVSSKVTLKWNVANSQILTDEQKLLLLEKLKTKLTTEGVLMLTAQESRSQFTNKESVLVKLDRLLLSAFTIKKARKRSKPTKSSIQKRLNRKKHTGEKKQWRKKL